MRVAFVPHLKGLPAQQSQSNLHGAGDVPFFFSNYNIEASEKFFLLTFRSRFNHVKESLNSNLYKRLLHPRTKAILEM